jgi:predicted O-methyltransferase YrrM
MNIPWHRLAHIRNAYRGTVLAFVPGHYHSSICDPDEVRLRYHDPLASTLVDIPGIDLNEAAQIARLKAWEPWFDDFNFSERQTTRARYYYGRGTYYAIGDALTLASFIRETRPRHIIEIGSGFSSACILDTLDQLEIDCACTFIDPEPETLLRLLRPTDIRPRIIVDKVQNVPLEQFDVLGAGDILLIDSSHVLKTCSDVNYELFDILPRLRPGVLVHFHDMFYPFEYPPDWVLTRNFSWNEAYAVRAMLSFSNRYRIVFWNHFLCQAHPAVVARHAPQMRDGSSLWISINEAQP